MLYNHHNHALNNKTGTTIVYSQNYFLSVFLFVLHLVLCGIDFKYILLQPRYPRSDKEHML